MIETIEGHNSRIRFDPNLVPTGYEYLGKVWGAVGNNVSYDLYFNTAQKKALLVYGCTTTSHSYTTLDENNHPTWAKAYAMIHARLAIINVNAVQQEGG